MKLKYIELFGFKSFAEKTKLSFNKDITAIVGPNGSGKSNIADAVKWVLGEQSAKSLRGTNMQDIIFSGTDNKKQMNMAQVSLILDNTDKSLPIAFDEVNVTRRVYRTGDSEYLINKSPVRLKDIKELFLDTGIGKDGYSMIGQGRIDEILNGKNEERRYIFEEACGISTNKYKKNEAEKRLIKNQENLEFLSNEIKIKQQETDILEKQSNNAKEGMKLTSRLELLELNLLKKSIEKINNDLIKDSSNLEYINKILEESNNELLKLNEKTAPISEKINLNSLELEKLKSNNFDNEKKLQSINSKIDLTNEKLKFYKLDIDRLKNSLDIKNKKIKEYKEKLELKVDNDNELNRKKEIYQQEIDNYNKELKNINTQLAELNTKLNQNLKSLNLEKEKLSNLKIDKSTKEKLDISNEKLKNSYEIEIKDLIKNIGIKESRVKELLKKQFEIDEILNENTKEIQKQIENREIFSSKILELEKKLNNHNNEYLKLESKKDLLERQYKSYEGYYKSVQNLLKISDKNPEIHKRIIGVLADLIQVDEKYKVAVDVALGSSLQNIVINNEEDGKFLINFIKKQNIGRITFLPINKIKGYKNDINHPKIINTLNNLVKYDKKIENIINYFLSKTILVRDMDDAILVSREISNYRIITLDGEIINSWGSMVGGNTFKKDSNSLLNRKKELQDIIINLKKYNENIVKYNEKLSLEKENLNQIIYNLSNLDNRNNDLISKKNSINSQIKEIEIEKNFNIKRKEEFESLLSNINEELKDVDFSNIENLANLINDLEKNINMLNSEINKINLNKANLELNIIKTNSNLEVTIRDLSISENDIEDLKFNIEENFENIKLDESNIKLAINEIEKSESKIKDYKNKLKDLTNLIINSKDKIILLESELKELKINIKNDSIRIDELKNTISDNEKEKFKLELKIESAEDKVKQFKSDYIDTYSIDEIVLEKKLNHLEVVEATKKEVISIKNRLSQIGYFNFETIEQYNIIKEELDFMKSQYEDLIKSRNDIIEMIKNIEKNMIETFNKTFEQIQLRFNEIFNILFNGGEAELKLDSDDVLTAGIEIIARPPGKKLTNLTLLSGGEKALTAVALLFAIFEINPAPFCVLDEIDAALDEGNIKRYFDYLKSLVDKTQFIIITHRKVSMEMSDVLYGVTMEEQGISKVITLELEEFN